VHWRLGVKVRAGPSAKRVYRYLRLCVIRVARALKPSIRAARRVPGHPRWRFTKRLPLQEPLPANMSKCQQLFALMCVRMEMRPNNIIVLRPLLGCGLFALLLLEGCGGGSNTTPPSTTPPPVASGSCTTPPVTITHTAPANSPQLVVLAKEKYPNAVCNDGTAGAYVLRSGAGAAANRWIISLQGGGECFDQVTCAARSSTMPTLVSTASYQANPSTAFGQSGLLGSTPANNPDFYDASVVQVLYCSSDDWSGNKTSAATYDPNDPTTWNWQGRAILNAVLADLTANHGFSSATEVMLTGQSAGGVGVFANANPVAKLIPPSARYVAYSDAAFPDGGQDYSASGSAPNYTSSATPNQITKRILGLPLWNGSGDPACSAASASDPASQILCYSGQTLLAPSTGTINLPMLVSVSEEDTNQLGTAGFPASATKGGTLTASQAGYLSYFASNMRTATSSTNANVSLFVPKIFVHVEATDPTYYNAPEIFPNGTISLQQEVGAWYKAPCSIQRNVAN
jgi:hypothetical protein